MSADQAPVWVAPSFTGRGTRTQHAQRPEAARTLCGLSLFNPTRATWPGARCCTCTRLAGQAST